MSTQYWYGWACGLGGAIGGQLIVHWRRQRKSNKEFFRRTDAALATLHQIPASRIDFPVIVCPKCKRKSANKNDIREGYCGNCHEWTSGSTLGESFIKGFFRR